MKTKKCKHCGWVIPATHKTRICPMCKKEIGQGLCSNCGNFAETLYKSSYCVDCYKKKRSEANKRNRALYHKVFNSRFEEWQYRISKVPKEYPTLSDKQWLKTCSHFNGCAFCGSDDISSRVYFVKFKDGGRYCDWNILPACEACALKAKEEGNPFKPLARGRIYTPTVLDNITAYLEPLLLEAMREEEEDGQKT